MLHLIFISDLFLPFAFQPNVVPLISCSLFIPTACAIVWVLVHMASMSIKMKITQLSECRMNETSRRISRSDSLSFFHGRRGTVVEMRRFSHWPCKNYRTNITIIRATSWLEGGRKRAFTFPNQTLLLVSRSVHGESAPSLCCINEVFWPLTLIKPTMIKENKDTKIEERVIDADVPIGHSVRPVGLLEQNTWYLVSMLFFMWPLPWSAVSFIWKTNREVDR